MTLQEQLNNELNVNESKTRWSDIHNYLVSWTYEQFDESDAKTFLRAIANGMMEGIADRKKYGVEDKYKKATKLLENVGKALELTIPK